MPFLPVIAFHLPEVCPSSIAVACAADVTVFVAWILRLPLTPASETELGQVARHVIQVGRLASYVPCALVRKFRQVVTQYLHLSAALLRHCPAEGVVNAVHKP